MDSSFNPFTLIGKKILVTGASSGIGKAIALSCAKMGASVIITGKNAQRLSETYSLMSGNNTMIQADLSDPLDIEETAKSVSILDGVVHCAGIGSRTPCKLITKSNIDLVMGINFESSVLLQSALLKNKKLNKAASIVFIASRAASIPSIGNALYSASKGAMISYAKCLALELAPRLIRVNCICPAMIWTNLILKGGITEDMLKEAEKKYPLKRYGQPEDIANLSIYLLSDASAWMTGSTIDITGGSINL